jgi:hypothetical protein
LCRITDGLLPNFNGFTKQAGIAVAHYNYISDVFLGTFAELRKATISFVMSVRPFFRMEQLGSHWKDFYEI